MFKPVRLALAAATAAAVLVPLGAAASAEPSAGQRSAAHYCARYDAYELRDCSPAPRPR